MRNFSPDLLPILVIIISVLIFFYPVFTKGYVPITADLIVGVYYPWLDYKWAGFEAGVPIKNPLTSDVPSVMYPQRLMAFELIKQGQLPLWNSLVFSGYPLIATFQSAVFYPLNIVYFFLPFLYGWSLGIIMQPILAAIFTYLLIRNFGLNKLSSLFGALAYAFGGFMIFWLEYNIHGHVAALIPLMLLLIDKYISTNKILYLLALSIVIAAHIFAGYPQLTLYTIILLIFWAVFRWEVWHNFRKVFGIGIIIFFIGLGIALSGIQLLPGLELYSLSQRQVEYLPPEYRFLPFEKLLVFFAPDFYGNPSTKNYWGPEDYTHNVVYSGLVTLILAFFSLMNIKHQKYVIFFWILVGTTLLMVFNTVIGRFLVENIHDEILRGSKAASLTRALVFVNLGVSILSAYGLNNLINLDLKLKTLVRILYIITLSFIAILIGTFASYEYLKLNQNMPRISEHSEIIKEGVINLSIAIRNLIFPTALLVSSVFVILVSFRFSQYKKWLLLLLLPLMLFDQMRFGWKITAFTPKEFVFPRTPIIDYLSRQEKPVRSLVSEVIPTNMWMPYWIESPDGYDAVYPKSIAQLISISNSNNIDVPVSARVGVLRDYRSRLIDLNNTKYLIARKYDSTGRVSELGKVDEGRIPAEKYTRVYEDKSVAVYENINYLPRAFFVTEWEILPVRQTFERIFSKDFPLDKKIVLEKDFQKFSQNTGNKSQVKYLKYLNQESTLEVETENPGLLFMSDTWYPGWKAKVDGQETEILVADYAFRAIPVDKGKHIVEVYYQPESFEKGKLLSFSSSIVLVIILMFTWLKRKIFYARP